MDEDELVLIVAALLYTKYPGRAKEAVEDAYLLVAACGGYRAARDGGPTCIKCQGLGWMGDQFGKRLTCINCGGFGRVEE
jgi:hypothetical protein